jgi:hypothetical protein
MLQSVSAFAPICNPTQCPWGDKAFKGYLGEDKSTWEEYDATLLVKKYNGPKTTILIDQVNYISCMLQLITLFHIVKQFIVIERRTLLHFLSDFKNYGHKC